MSLVGPIVDLIGSPADGSATTSPPYTGTGDDFAIGDLLFKIKPGDQTPYQRATAQFRKDQFDAGTQAGDQSLTGWWTRGEFSFHKGAGVTYYEVSEGDTILNRYKDGDGVYPFTVGEVTCQHDWTKSSSTFVSVFDFATWAPGVLIRDGSTLKWGPVNSLTSVTPAGGGTVQRSCVDSALDVAYYSTSAGKIESLSSTGTSTVLYTGLTTNTRAIFFAKQRLFVYDGDGKWYQLSTTPASPPVAVGSGDVIFNVGRIWPNNHLMCDTPGPILLGNSTRIFALTVDSSTGTIPTLSAPIQVAELPPGEYVLGLAYTVGFVVIVTTAGVRIAVLSDSGQLTYGPLLVERTTTNGSTSKTTIGKIGTRALVSIDNRIIEIDLAEQIGTGLEFAWTGRGDPLPDAAAGSGSATLIDGTTNVEYAWARDGVWSKSSNYLAGTLTTGLHRYATLENKRFDSVQVHVSGSHGTVAVSKIDDHGAETLLYTVEVSAETIVDVPLRMDEGIPALALKFSLAPDAAHPDETPTLLGYQLKALPEPARQRMIQVPLMAYGVVRRQPARASGTSAWDAVRALEDLEVTRAVVPFTDYRTGESGRAFIESVQFSNVTPPTSGDTGFGGTITATLRKL